MLPPGSRTSKIKPPRKSITNSPSNNQPFDFDKSWQILSSAIVQIQNKNVSNLSYEQLYRNAYTLVLHKLGNRLYENVSELIKTNLLERRVNLLSIFHDSSSTSYINTDEEFIKRVLSEWDEHLQSMKFISDVLMYLNRVYIKEQNKLLIYDLGTKLFKDFVIKYNNNELGDLIIGILIKEIQKNRNGEIISTKIYITKIINMFELLHEDTGLSDVSVYENYYQKYFEAKFLSTSKDYFDSLIEKFMGHRSGLHYLVETNRFLKEETDRINFYLPETTIPKLLELMNNILIKSQLDHIINHPSDGLQYWIQPIKNRIISGNSSDSSSIIDTDQLTYLETLYTLNHKIDENCELLKIRLKQIILKEGSQFPLLVKETLNSSEDKPGNAKKASLNSPAFANRWINSILQYKVQFFKIVKTLFKHDYSVEQYIFAAFQEFINLKNKSKKNPVVDPNCIVVNPSELLSIYMDSNIKLFLKPSSSSSKDKMLSNDLSITSVDEFIDNSMQFLRFIIDKDAFEAYYKNHFAKRFLNSKGFARSETFGGDIEEIVISRLNEELGTSAMDNIFKMNMDIKLSRDVTAEWKNYLMEQKDPAIIDMDLKICNVSYWPTSMTKDYKKLSGKLSMDSEKKFIWPRKMKHTIQRFEQFWGVDKKNSNKSLYWSPKFGSMDLKVTYPSRTYEINLSTYAGIIMLLFGPSHSLEPTDSAQPAFDPFKQKKKFTYKQIEELTGIPGPELRRHLQSIAVASRLRLLTKIPMSKDVKDDDSFELNEKFKSPSVKVKVLTVSASSSSSTAKSKKPVDDEIEMIENSINDGRKHEINAAIVRVLKSRQSVYHNELVSEIIRQLQSRFLPNNSQIKRHIEDLIEKEYLLRDDDNRNLYHYIA